MVVAVDGRMRRSEYRKFRIRAARARATIRRSSDRADRTVPDDFAAMHEVVLRRYRRVLEQGGPFPDLILIDGGKGQLTAAYAALRELGLERLVAVGIAKKEELLFTRDRVEGIALPRESPRAAAAAAHPRRGAPLRDHLPPPVADASATCGRRWTTCRASARAAASSCSRRSDRSPACGARAAQELEAAVGAKAADAVSALRGARIKPRSAADQSWSACADALDVA